MPVSVPAPAIPVSEVPPLWPEPPRAVTAWSAATAAGAPADAAAACGYRDLDLDLAIAALRGLALASVAAAVRGRGGGRALPAASRPAAAALPGGRIDAAAIAALWPLVVAPALAGRRRQRAGAMLRAPLPGHDPEAGAAALPDLAVMAAAAVTPPRRSEQLMLAVTPAGGVVAGAAILAVVAAAALQHPAVAAAIDAMVRERLSPEVVLPRGMAPVRLSDRGLLTLIAMELVARPVVTLPTRRQRFGRAFTGHVAALWPDGEVPRGYEAWLLTEALRRHSRLDPRLAAVVAAAGMLRWPRFAAAGSLPDTAVPDTAGPDTTGPGAVPEPLARFLRCEP